jgi:hypothetical protein
VTSDGFLLLLNEGGDTLACLYLVQGLACNNHDSDERFLFSVRGSDGDLSCGRGVLLLPLDNGGDLLPVDSGEVRVAA